MMKLSFVVVGVWPDMLPCPDNSASPPDMCGLSAFRAAIAQLGERQTEDLKVPGSIPGLGICARHEILEPASCWHFTRKLGSKTV